MPPQFARPEQAWGAAKYHSWWAVAIPIVVLALIRQFEGLAGSLCHRCCGRYLSQSRRPATFKQAARTAVGTNI